MQVSDDINTAQKVFNFFPHFLLLPFIMSKPSQHIHLREVNMMQIEVKIQSAHSLILMYQGFQEYS